MEQHNFLLGANGIQNRFIEAEIIELWEG